jgi:hypothetical protein
MGQLLYDKLNSFGRLDLSTAGTPLTFPDILDLDGAEVSRMTVDLKRAGAAPAVSGAPTAAGVTVSVEGSNDAAFAAKEVIGQRAVSLADLRDLTEGKGRVAISTNRYRYIRVSVAKTFTGGTTPAFTAGQFEALVNSYLGK